jgi:hypothetical protein
MTPLWKELEITPRIRTSGAVDWMFEMLADPDTTPVVVEFIVIALANIVHLPDLDDKELEWDDERLAAQVFQRVVPACKTFYKTHPDIVVRSFQLFTETLHDAKEKAAEMRTIALASVLLVVLMDRFDFVLINMTFLWACAEQGLIAELKAVDKVLPNVMKALGKYTSNQWIVERCVGFAVLMDHPKRIDQLQCAVRQFPQSVFLKELTKRDDVSSIIQQQFAKFFQ